MRLHVARQYDVFFIVATGHFVDLYDRSTRFHWADCCARCPLKVITLAVYAYHLKHMVQVVVTLVVVVVVVQTEQKTRQIKLRGKLHHSTKYLLHDNTRYKCSQSSIFRDAFSSV